MEKVYFLQAGSRTTAARNQDGMKLHIFPSESHVRQ